MSGVTAQVAAAPVHLTLVLLTDDSASGHAASTAHVVRLRPPASVVRPEPLEEEPTWEDAEWQ